MTELERIFKDTLARMEREMATTLEAHAKTLAEHQRTLEAQSQAIQRLQENSSRIASEQQESTRHLQRLSAVHASLEPLLSRLNGLLSGK